MSSCTFGNSRMVHHAILQRNVNLGSAKITLKYWNGLDLNPIENLWSRLKRAVATKHPSNKQQLIEAVINSLFHIIDLRTYRSWWTVCLGDMRLYMQ